MVIAVREEAPNEVLPAVWFHDDLGVGTVNIAAGATIEGEVRLGAFVQDFKKELAKSGVLVFWSYRWSQDQDPDLRFGGWAWYPHQPR